MATKDEVLAGNRFLDNYGKTWRRNGRNKLWKTRPNEFRVPVKFGLYSYDYITELDLDKVEVVG